MLCPFWIYRFISLLSVSPLTRGRGRGKDLPDVFPFSIDGPGEQTHLPVCDIDVLCHNKPQYILFIYVLQACHNSLALQAALPLCTLNSHVVTLNSGEFTLHNHSGF